MIAAISPWILTTAKTLAPAVGVLIAFILYVIARNRLDPRIKKLHMRWQQLIVGAFTVLWAMSFTFLWEHTRNLQDLHTVAAFLHWGPLQLLTACLVLAIGWLAYWGKQNHQFIYGGVEIAVAMGTAMISANGISRDPNTFTRVATIVGAIYIVSRGMENMNKAIEQEQKNK